MSGVYVQGNVQISCLECDNVTSGHQARGSMGQDPPQPGPAASTKLVQIQCFLIIVEMWRSLH